MNRLQLDCRHSEVNELLCRVIIGLDPQEDLAVLCQKYNQIVNRYADECKKSYHYDDCNHL